MVVVAAVVGVGAAAPRLGADEPPARARPSLALLRLDPLGLDGERALRLEALFRAELERLRGAPLPARTTVEAALARDPTLRGCTGEPPCLAALGRALGVAQVVTGNVGALGESYVVNLKLVDVARAVELRRVSETLAGSPDQLIDAVRVAAYRLVAPEALRGTLAVLCDVSGASVLVDGKPVGVTPLPAPVADLTVGRHELRLEAPGLSSAVTSVEVRFQKTTEVVMHLSGPLTPAQPVTPTGSEAPSRWYHSPWAWAAVGVGALAVGALVGRALASERTVDCARTPAECRP
jgi:hypothetical protein